MNPKDFLAVANQLLDKSNEAKYRTSANRSYYTLFLSLKNHLSGSPYNIIFSRYSTHLDLRSVAEIGKMTIQSSSGRIPIAGVLKETHEKRIDADYEIKKVFRFEDAEDSYDEVNNILGQSLPPLNIFLNQILKCCRIIKISNYPERFLFIYPNCKKTITCGSKELGKELSTIGDVNIEIDPSQIRLFDENACNNEYWLYSKNDGGKYKYYYRTFVLGRRAMEYSYETYDKLITEIGKIYNF